MFARTERLLLRPGWPEDARALASLLKDPAVTLKLFDLSSEMTEDDARALLSAERDPLAPQMLMFARTGGAPRLVGGCALTPGDGPEGACELSFWIGRPFWGLGFATEAVIAAVRAARAAGWNRVVACPGVDNNAAAHVLSKAGFRPTGRTGKRFSRARGGAVSCAVFADSDMPPMRSDLARTLYRDRAPMAA